MAQFLLVFVWGLCSVVHGNPLTTAVFGQQATSSVELHATAKAQEHAALPCQLLTIGSDPLVAELARVIAFDLRLTDQLDISLASSKTALPAAQEQALSASGTSLLASLHTSQPGNVTFELKDLASDSVLETGAYKVTKSSLASVGHQIADRVVRLLTGSQTTPFLGTLAFCQRKSSRQKEICIADIACKQVRRVITAPTLNVAPCWHTQAPVLFYSQFTRSNSRLMAYHFNDKGNRIVCSYDGLNMQPSFSPDGQRAVLCLSGSGNSELYLYDQLLCTRIGKRVFIKLTSNGANNASPCMLPDGSVIYCSDLGHSGRPQLYLLDSFTRQSRLLTNGQGYCASPAYNPVTGMVVYTRCIKGTFQLCVLDPHTVVPVERQLTTGPGDKVDPTWSPCGGYVACSYQCKRQASQIALVPLHSRKVHVLTSTPEEKSFPSWTAMNLYQRS